MALAYLAQAAGLRRCRGRSSIFVERVVHEPLVLVVTIIIVHAAEPFVADEPFLERLGWSSGWLRFRGKSLCKLVARFLRRRHAAVDDHAACEGDRCLCVHIVAVDGVAVSEASTRGILDAPRLARARPFDLRPNLAIDA